MEAEIALLSDEDRKLLFESVRESRLSNLKDRMAGLSENALDALAKTGKPVTPKTK
jgi:hypothetical protein